MRDKTNEPKELTAQAEALVGIAREAADEVGQAEASAGLAALHARLERRGRGRRLWAGLAAAAAVLVLVGLSLERYAAPAALSFHVDGGAIRDGYVQSAGENGSRIAFSDGSVITLGEHTRLHIHSLESRGGRFALEDGQVQVDVAHREGSDWKFYAGPFLIEVKGTAFDLRWKSALQRLELRLLRGNVSVHGPLSADPIVLNTGQALSISVPDRRVVVRGLDSAAETEQPQAVAPAAAPEPSSEPAAAPAASTTSVVDRASSWTAKLAAGRAADILEQVDRLGLEPSLAGRSAEDLAALADAARYRGRPEIALRALLMLRQRFSRSNAGIDAAFQLGRLEQAAHPDEAIRWYDRYLQEAPAGPYAAEALGLEMVTVQRFYGSAGARPVAQKYLESYPSGAYAAAAKAIVQGP
jgi:FecR protein